MTRTQIKTIDMDSTPRPWRLTGKYITGNDCTIATCNSYTLKESHANAKLIVHCVNVHDELVEALKLISTELEYRNKILGHYGNDYWLNIRNTLKQALNHAEGE